jgi:Protein of unknown function (DUF4254)
MTASTQSLRCHAHLEPGVRLLRQRIGVLGGRTFRGCEGHPAVGDLGLQQRHVGIAPSDEREHGELLATLRRVAAQVNSASDTSSRVAIEVGESELRCDSRPRAGVVDIVFAPQPGLIPEDYFEHLAAAYWKLCEQLRAELEDRRDSTAAGVLSAAHQFYDMALSWHCKEPTTSPAAEGITGKVLHLHAMNFALWHHEDAVRRTGIGDQEVARRKGRIDDLNARRNAAIEDIDMTLLDCLNLNDSAPLHTETPGTIVDRLSVLALRVLHTNRAEGPSSRLAALEEQYDDLFCGLEQFLTRLQGGGVRFKTYRQFKSAGQRDYCALFETRDT